ncbi:MAG: hypothetical protein AAGI03_15005, partial [Pseudomonadota bacterium]
SFGAASAALLVEQIDVYTKGFSRLILSSPFDLSVPHNPGSKLQALCRKIPILIGMNQSPNFSSQIHFLGCASDDSSFV